MAIRILLMSSSYNSLTQLAHVELKARGHTVGIAAATHAEKMRLAVSQFRPELIVCPMLAQVIPDDIWQATPCMILHPGVPGDRGPSSLDWAILNGEAEWGTTVVEAAEEMDSGPIWASFRFKMRECSKSSLYRDEVARAALDSMLLAVQRFESGLFVPAPLDYSRPEVTGRCRPVLRAAQRQIDWQSDPVDVIVRKIRSADGHPGVLDEIGGEPFYLFGAHREGRLVGKPGEIIAQRHGAICRGAVDGAVWITHLRRQGKFEDGCFKLPAANLLGLRLMGVPEVPAPLHGDCGQTYRDIWYEEDQEVGYLHFNFYNGAMGTDHCRRLAEAVLYARQRPTKVIVLCGGHDFWSNGIHLNLIEAALDPAQESWDNIVAMDDLVHALLTATDQLTIAALYGSAGAGGVMLALAADRVLTRSGIVLNPHYKGMGGLYGSEYWTYSLPKRVGPERARQLTDECLPIGVEEAKAIGLIDDIVVPDHTGQPGFTGFWEQITRMATALAANPQAEEWLSVKRHARETDEAVKPLDQYRVEELEEMNQNFWGPDRCYHEARSAFVRKQPRPSHLTCYAAAACGENCEAPIKPARGRVRGFLYTGRSHSDRQAAADKRAAGGG